MARPLEFVWDAEVKVVVSDVGLDEVQLLKLVSDAALPSRIQYGMANVAFSRLLDVGQ